MTPIVDCISVLLLAGVAGGTANCALKDNIVNCIPFASSATTANSIAKNSPTLWCLIPLVLAPMILVIFYVFTNGSLHFRMAKNI
jgi:hypothetical protein